MIASIIRRIHCAVPVFAALFLLAACVTTQQEPSPEALAILAKAEQGDAEAQFKAGTLYDWGRGVSRSGSEAVKWYPSAAEAGLAEAQNSMGSVMQAERRYEEARPWYEKAVAQNHAPAINSLAHLYDAGLGVPQDRRKGFELYSRAADLGWAEAMWNIAAMYGAGQLGEKDPVAACVWTFRANRFARSRTEVDRVSRRSIASMDKSLTPQQMNRCLDEAPNWSPPGLR